MEDGGIQGGSFGTGEDGLSAQDKERLFAQAQGMMGRAPENLSDIFANFFHETDWTEPWLLCLITFHVVLFLLTVAVRRNPNFQAGLFLATVIVAYLSESINHWAARNHERFSAHNYFDSRGFFISMVWSGPLVVTALTSVVLMLASASSLLVGVKRAEKEARARASAKAASSNASDQPDEQSPQDEGRQSTAARASQKTKTG